MKIKKLLTVWSRIINVPVSEMSINKYDEEIIKAIPSTEIIKRDELESWRIRLCDRADRDKWLPYRIVTTRDIRVYYVNVFADKTPLRTHLILKMVGGVNVIFDEWGDSGLISSTPGVIEKNPSAIKPNDEEMMQMLFYGLNCGMRITTFPELPTYDQKNK